MAIDMFATRTMVGIVENIVTPKTFLRDTFFGRVETSQTEYVDFDKVSPNRKVAPFVRREMEGKPVEAYGYSTKIFVPPYVKPKIKTDAGDLFKRAAGETIYSDVTPAQRAAAKLGKDLASLIDMVVRREELMCSEIVRTGIATIIGDGYNATIDFGMHNDNKIALTGGDRWTESTSTPVDDLEDATELVEEKSGIVPDVILMGVNAAKDFRKHASVKELLDNRRVEMGEIIPQRLPSGVKYLGVWDNIDIYQYSEWYADDAGVLQRTWPADGVLVGSSQNQCAMHYGAIYDIDMLTGENAGLVEGRYFPKSWVTPDPSCRWLMLQSAPLPGLYNPDAFVYLDVEAPA